MSVDTSEAIRPLRRGDDRSFEVTFDEPSLGTPKVLTDYTFLAHARAYADGPLLATLAITVGSAANKRLLSLTRTQTALFTRDVVCDLQATRISDGYVETWAYWTIPVQKDVTHA